MSGLKCSGRCVKQHVNTPARQRGAALLVFFILVGIGMLALFTGSLNTNETQLERQRIAPQALAQAKEALLGYATSPSSSGQRPGDLLRPDNFASTESPPNYDGQSDSGCLDASQPSGLPLIATGQNQRCLGRLPWRTLGMQIDGPSENDPTGIMPWYAVSANLVDPTCLATLNSSILNLAYTGYSCAGTSLPHPWLTVVDSKGNVLSNRVALVVIIPGPPIGSQSRPVSPLAGPTAYLDTVTVLPSCTPPCVPGTYSNAAFSPGNQFIAGEDSSRVAATDPNYQQPYLFNDKLIYVTIDELIVAVEKRVGNEVKAAMAAFKSNYANYPWLAPFADPSMASSFRAQAGVAAGLQGLVPYNGPGQSFDTEFNWSVTGTPTYTVSGTVTSAVMGLGSIGVNDGVCTWTATGLPLKQVQCTATLSNPQPGVAKRVVSLKFGGTSGTSSTQTVGTPTTHTTRKVVCSGNLVPSSTRCLKLAGDFTIKDYDSASTLIGSGTITGGTGTITTSNIRLYPALPDWYVDNQWQQFVYGAVAPGYSPGSANLCSAGCLNVGSRTDVQALVITAGKAILNAPFAASKGSPGAAQTRPSGSLADYLDSVENSNGDNTFDAPSNSVAPNNNDMIFIVAP